MSKFGVNFKEQSTASDAPDAGYERMYARSTGQRSIVVQYPDGNEAPIASTIFTVSTTNATPTEIAVIDGAETDRFKLRVEVLAFQDDESDIVSGNIEGVFYRNNAGNITQVGTTQDNLYTNSAGSPTVAFTANASNQQVDIDVTGVAAENWDWTVYIYRYDMGS